MKEKRCRVMQHRPWDYMAVIYVDIPANQYPTVSIALRIAGNKYTLQATYCKIIIECNDALRGMYRGRYVWNSWLRAWYCKVLVLQGIGDTELQALHRTGAGVAAQAWQAVTHREATAAFPAVFQCTEPLAMQCSHLFLQKILLSSVFEKGALHKIEWLLWQPSGWLNYREPSRVKCRTDKVAKDF